MSHKRSFRLPAVLLTALVLSLAPGAAAQKDKDKKKAKEPPPQGTAVLWRDPGDVAALDLLLGPGGAEMKPDLSRLTFLKDEKGGYSKKFRVRDAAGRVWVAKVGKEAQPETAVTRLVWAAGYPVEVTYLAPCARIDGAPKPKEAEQCEGGGYSNVRFEARPENVKRLDAWRWEQNPFSGKRELRGLKIMMALVENWDMKDDNNRVLAVSGPSGTELQHVVSNLGATIGKTGGQSGPISFIRQVKGTRNEPGDYVADKFIERRRGRPCPLQLQREEQRDDARHHGRGRALAGRHPLAPHGQADRRRLPRRQLQPRGGAHAGRQRPRAHQPTHQPPGLRADAIVRESGQNRPR